MNTRIAALATSVALAGTGAFAQLVDAWDGNGDGIIDETEFREGFVGEGVFDRWDEDADGMIGSEELADGLYGLWDADDDGELSVDEWDAGVDLWLGEETVDLSVEAWDEDSDGVVSRFEFSEALATTNLLDRFDAADADGFLGEDELTSGLFDVADVDDDAALGPDEDSWLTDAAEFFAPAHPGDGEVAEADAADSDDLQIIERGEAFTALPVPCGQDGNCAAVARDFCSVLGYGDPIDFLDVDGAIHAIRCTDDP